MSNLNHPTHDNHCAGHNHDHDHHCDHGHDHDHDHHCDHGHDHDHDHHCDDPNCGCEQHSHTIELSGAACDFLLALGRDSAFPLARFMMVSTKSEHMASIALAPVYLTGSAQTVVQVREVGETLLDLEDMGLIVLDYDNPIEEYDYELYHNSAAYQALKDVVKQGSQQEGFLFDGTSMETGSIILTQSGQDAVEQLSSGDTQ